MLAGAASVYGFGRVTWPMFGFAFVEAGTAWAPELYRFDARVRALDLAQTEGHFATLTIDIKNPRVGLLAPSREVWCWLSWRRANGEVVPMFNGRLIGAPANLHAELITLTFRAKPADYEAQRAALAEAMRVPPYWDEIWQQQQQATPGAADDAVLEAYAMLWHVDRTALVLTASDVTAGEDGTLEVFASDHSYAAFSQGYGEAPKQRVTLSGTVKWPQTGEGDVDITAAAVEAFAAVGGSPYPPIVNSLTGDGLFSDWPKPGGSIGAGWTWGPDTSIVKADWLQEHATKIRYIDKSEAVETPFQNPFVDPVAVFFNPWKTWQLAVLLSDYAISLDAHYSTVRNRTEIVTMTLVADIQPLIVDSEAVTTVSIDLTSALLDKPIDPGGALPIGDLRRNTFFKTDRGQLAVQNLLLLGRAQLVTSARAVNVTFQTSWELAYVLTCRWSVRLHDPRLPSGEATGKVIEYHLTARPGEVKATVTIGCTIGNDVPVVAVAGEGVYCEDGILADGVQARTSDTFVPVIAGVLQYQTFDDFEVTDDDGVDLFNMTADRVILSLSVTGGPVDQVNAMKAAAKVRVAPDPAAALKATPTVLVGSLKPVTGGDFLVEYQPAVSPLTIPQTINLAWEPAP